MRELRLRILRTGLAAVVCAFAGVAAAQDAGRGSTPPGTSQDGSSPAQGAIKGGAIEPGEQGGVPATPPAARDADKRAAQRCKDLTGTLRDQCFRDLDSSAGATRAPAGPDGRSPRTTPPPQNPR